MFGSAFLYQNVRAAHGMCQVSVTPWMFEGSSARGIKRMSVSAAGGIFMSFNAAYATQMLADIGANFFFAVKVWKFDSMPDTWEHVHHDTVQ